MFESDAPVGILDYFRVPYCLAGGAGAKPRRRLHTLTVATAPGRGRSLVWPGAPRGADLRHWWAGWFRGLGSATLPGHLARVEPARALGDRRSRWRVRQPLADRRGRVVAAVWEDDDGNVFLPFDPDEVMRLWWTERYTGLGARAVALRTVRALAVRGYYAARPVLPRPVQLTMRRAVARRQHDGSSPAWPIELSLHQMYAWYFDVLSELAGRPVPSIAPWPDGRRWAMVLTHDVETESGLSDIELLREDERRLGYRSSWNLVGGRYSVSPEMVSDLIADGCEVGVHGLLHDGRDLASSRRLRQRLPAMRALASEWSAVGFRPPATQRSWRLMPRLGFDYDSSYSDTDPYEPQPGGCGSLLPYMIDDLVELPITLPQDHTLYEILGHQDAALWLSKSRSLRDLGGMALVLAHPDYARNPAAASAWRAPLEEHRGDATMWHALPHEVARWWRDRAQSRLVRTADDAWAVAGPAAPRATVRSLGFQVRDQGRSSATAISDSPGINDPEPTPRPHRS
jgi:hypothetical protein